MVEKPLAQNVQRLMMWEKYAIELPTRLNFGIVFSTTVVLW